MDKTELPDWTLRAVPRIHPSVYIAPGAIIVGDVQLEEGVSVWFHAVLRGDIQAICVGSKTNIQDGCILHVENDLPCVIGSEVTIGHGAILHGCRVGHCVLIGMGAKILSGAEIGEGSIIAAGAVVKEGTVVPPFSLMAGVPARFIRELDPDVKEQNRRWAEKYKRLAALYKAGERPGGRSL